MREGQVSVKVVQVVADTFPRNGVSWETFLRNVGLTKHEVEGKEFVTWTCFARILRGFGEFTGGLEAVERLGEVGPDLPANAWFRRLTGWFASSKSVYWALMRFYAPKVFPSFQFRFEDLGMDQVRIEMEIPPEFEGSLVYHHFWKGGLRVTPKVLGQPDALIRAEITPHKAVYTITCPPSLSVLGRIRRAGYALSSARGAIEILSEQEAQLREQFEERLRVERLVIEQEVKLNLAGELAGLSKMSALGEMAAGIAHEINNSLSIVAPRASVLMKDLERGNVDPARLVQGLEAIRNAAVRMGKIVDGLQAYATSDHTIPMEGLPVMALLDSTLSLCQERIRDAGIRLEVEGVLSDLRIECHPVQVSEVLLNLIGNSIDAVQSAPEKRIRLAVADRTEGVEFAIEDSGAGVPEELRDKIFMPFFTSKGAGKGTGLGLSISRGLVELHGGALTLDADAARTRFVMWLPKRRPAVTWP